VSGALTLSLGIFVALFFAVAAASQARRIPLAFWEHPAVFALAFVGVSGVMFFFGAIELVGRYGISGLIGIFAFAGVFIFSPLFLEPLRWISRSHAFATLPDLLVYRFRNPWVARATSILLALASLPIAAAQFSVIASLLPSPTPNQSPTLWLTAGLAAVAAVFIWLFGAPNKANRAVPGIAGFTTLIATCALLGTGVAAVYQVFDGLEGVNQWAQASGQNQVIMRFDSAYALILLLFPMAFILPQQGFILNLSSWWPKHSTSAWMVPCALLAITLPVFPVLWAGLNSTLDVPLQQYYLALPSSLGLDWLRVLTEVAMLFAGVSLIAVTALAMARILVTAFVNIADFRFRQRNLDRWLRERHVVIATSWLAAACIFSTLKTSGSVTDLAITGMIGLIQLFPGLIATFYVPKINHKGFLAGLAVGTGLWLYGVVAPVFFGATPAPVFGMNLAMGPENWQFWLLESLVANLIVTLFVSRVTTMSDDERLHAFHCMVDNLPTPRRQGLEISSLDSIQASLGEWLGRDGAQREMDEALATLKISLDDQRPLAMRMLRDRLSYQLSAKLGTLAAEHIMDLVIPFGSGPTVDDISLLESQLTSAGSALSGLAAELNKLRLYHRQTLENLPIGVCSIDPAGEILLWNNALTSYTGITAADAEGANLDDIPAPWGPLLGTFCADSAVSWAPREVPHGDRTGWYHLSKYRVEDNSPVYSGYQVVLMEDITERLKLLQELAHAERLTSVGRLAAGVAHEIGNPVTGISCLAQDLLADAKDEETTRSAAIILDLTERINSIVRTLIEFSRSDSKDALKPIPLKPAVDSAIQLLQLDRHAKVVEFRATIAEDLLVRGDSHQLAQVFVNLLANARDASDSGDVVEISCDESDPQQVVVQVTDWGCGIPAALQNRVMEPFFTTKDSGEGTGLGLSMVYSIIRFHRGSVKLASPVAGNRGTRVTLTLKRP